MPTEFDTPSRQARRRNRPSRWATAAACGALLTACQIVAPADPVAPTVQAAAPTVEVTIEPPKPEAAPVSDATAVETHEERLSNLLRYAEQLRTMSPAERKLAINTLGSRLAKPGASGTPKDHMQLALALLQTREPVETARALGLFQRVASNPEAEARVFAPLAQVLIDNLITTRRLEDNLERASQQLRDSQRRNEALSERLDAMLAIERSMNAPPAPPRPLR